MHYSCNTVRLYNKVGNHTWSVGSETFSNIDVQPPQSLSRALHDHSLSEKDGSGLAVTVKVTIEHGAEKYRYSYSFSGAESSPWTLGKMPRDLVVWHTRAMEDLSGSQAGSATGNGDVKSVLGGGKGFIESGKAVNLTVLDFLTTLQLNCPLTLPWWMMLSSHWVKYLVIAWQYCSTRSESTASTIFVVCWGWELTGSAFFPGW